MTSKPTEKPHRIRVIAGPWPERIGCEGVTVPPSVPRPSYPWHGLRGNEVVILLDNDPLGKGVHPDWSCVYNKNSLEYLDE